MTSDRRILANRLNARRSTGPRTPRGKSRSRRNAIKHGLTARTIVDIFEDGDEFNAFVRQIAAAYRPTSPVHRELICRLATLLWRLRRVHAAETGLLHIQAHQQQEIQTASHPAAVPQNIIALPGLNGSLADYHVEQGRTEAKAQAFLRLCNINGETLDRISRYETALWRQTVQLLFLLDPISATQSPTRFLR
jgi:hypothetical protein